MKAINRTASPVELDPVNGPGLLAPALPEYDGEHVRELVEVTDRERGLEEAGTILLDGDPSEDRYDGMDRDALKAEAAEREVEVSRKDGRTDIDPTENEYRRALRVADTDDAAGGGS